MTIIVTAAALIAAGVVGAASASAAVVDIKGPITGSVYSVAATHHHPYGGDWAMDIAGGGDVYARFAGGNVSLHVDQVAAACTSSNGGTRVVVRVLVDGSSVGVVTYAHLAGVAVQAGETYGNGVRLGTVATGLPQNENCWTGPHVHLEPRNDSSYACYAPLGQGAAVSASVTVGRMGAVGATGAQQACSSGPAPGSPYGSLDMAAGAARDSILLSGWGIDPDDMTGSIQVHVYLDGPAGAGTGSAHLADVTRIDVAAAFPGAGPAHGFALALPSIPPGQHGVWVYLINRAGGGDNVLLGQRTVDVPVTPANAPLGSFDDAAGAVSGRVRIRGWAADPDVKQTPLSMHVYADGPAGAGGRFLGALDADGSRSDVAATFPGYGDKHGFDALLGRLDPGTTHTVYVYAIDAPGGGTNPLLGARTVRIPGPEPIGRFEAAFGTASSTGGKAVVAGWTLDPEAPGTPTTVHVYADGPAGQGAFLGALDADATRGDVATAFPGASAGHGFSGALGPLTPGKHTLYAYGINLTGAGGNPLLGAREVTVPSPAVGAPDGRFDGAQGVNSAGTGGAIVRGWTVDPDAPAAATDVHVYDGPAGLTSSTFLGTLHADRARDDVAATKPGAGSVHGFEGEVSGLTPGTVRYLYVYAINAAGPGNNPLLGVRRVAVPAEPQPDTPADPKDPPVTPTTQDPVTDDPQSASWTPKVVRLRIRHAWCATSKLTIRGRGVELVAARWRAHRCRLKLSVRPGATGRRDLIVRHRGKRVKLRNAIKLG